jgi:transposase
MSQKEARRPGLVQAARDEDHEAEGAKALGLSVRQFRRLKVTYGTRGASGLMHGLRGVASSKRLDPEVRERLRELACGIYADLNDSHATEKIREVNKLLVGRETVRKLRREEGLPPKRRRRPPQHRQRRARRERRGSLVLIDGSDHAWFGKDRPCACLVGAIDDATSEILSLVFRPDEDLHGYFEMLRCMAVKHGLPLQIYGDRLSVLARNDPHWTLEEELLGKRSPTQFGRVLAELGIGFIEAQSPEAKGRIERLWGTLQDRLVAELALAGITGPVEAEAFLPIFLEDHNRRFAKAPGQTLSAFQKPPKDLSLLLACHYDRVVAKDNTVSIPGRWCQLPKGPGGRSWSGRRVDVRELLDGRLVVFLDGQAIAFQKAQQTPFTLAPRGHIARRRQLGNDAPRKSRPELKPMKKPLKDKAASSGKPSPTHPWKQAAVRPVSKHLP